MIQLRHFPKTGQHQAWAGTPLLLELTFGIFPNMIVQKTWTSRKWGGLNVGRVDDNWQDRRYKYVTGVVSTVLRGRLSMSMSFDVHKKCAVCMPFDVHRKKYHRTHVSNPRIPHPTRCTHLPSIARIPRFSLGEVLRPGLDRDESREPVASIPTIFRTSFERNIVGFLAVGSRSEGPRDYPKERLNRTHYTRNKYCHLHWLSWPNWLPTYRTQGI